MLNSLNLDMVPARPPSILTQSQKEKYIGLKEDIGKLPESEVV